MSKHQLFTFVLCLTGAVVLAQTLPPTLPHPNNQGYYGGPPRNQPVRRASHLNGKDWLSVLKQPTASPEWQPSAALPISLAAAEKAARLELSKIVPDASEWVTTDFHISRFGAGPDWYYAVTLEPILQLSGEPRESFTALVDFVGTPGQVVQLGPHQMR